MTTGYLAAGKCWPTAAEAIDARFSSVPIQFAWNPPQGVEEIMVTEKYGGHWYYSFFSGHGVLMNQVTPDSETTLIGTCTLEQTWDGTYDYTAAAAAWSFAFVTVLGTWLLAKNMGIIISAIKRW